MIFEKRMDLFSLENMGALLAQSGNLSDEVREWLFGAGVKIVLLIVGLYLAHKAVEVLLARLIRKLITPDRFTAKEEEEKREETLIKVISVTLHVIIWIFGGMVVLSELGVDIGPLIAAAGIGGLALGFGGQYLISDIINGLFITLENQYRVGDIVCVGEVCGVVEDVNLRRTVLRDLDGVVHTIPNGEVKIASNLSHQYTRVNLNVGVSYDTDLEHAIAVINRVGNELAQDPDWQEQIREAPQFLRVDAFGDSAIELKILGETKPAQQWDVTGELRKRLKVAFDKEGIEIPYPHRVVVHKNEKA